MGTIEDRVGVGKMGKSEVGKREVGGIRRVGSYEAKQGKSESEVERSM